jgi:small subunit ribosomal protein S16
VAVKIRLKRMGAKKRPFYRVVVADARSPRDGRFIESVGYYDPLKDPKVFHVDDERIRHWMATGARPSDAVRELLVRQGTLEALPHPVRTKTGPKRAAKSAPAAVVAPAPAAPAAETATEEEAAPADEPVAAEAESESAAIAETAEPEEPVASAEEAGDAGPEATAAQPDEEAPTDGSGEGDAVDAESTADGDG